MTQVPVPWPARTTDHDDDHDTTDDPFARWFHMILSSRGLSNAAMGRLIDTDGSLVSKWRRGRQRPDSLSCRLIAEALGIPVREVMIQAGHADPGEALDDPVKRRLHELIDLLPSPLLEPYVLVFDRLLTAR